jgi:hypothetical protein
MISLRAKAEQLANEIIGKRDIVYKSDIDAIESTLRECIEACAKVAENPYSDAVEALGGDEPSAVGRKIARAIRAQVEHE